jgi:hypothetical protein
MTLVGPKRSLALTWGKPTRMPATLPDMPTPRMTLQERAQAGGHGRATSLTDTQRTESARKAATAAHRPEALARRIVKAWPMLSDAERGLVRAILAELD